MSDTGTRSRWDQIKRSYLEDASRRAGVSLTLRGRRGARWADCDAGPVAVLGSRDHGQGGLWWFGLREEEFDDRSLGIILLCETGSGLVDIGLHAPLVRKILPGLSMESHARERKLHLIRRGDSYLLRLADGVTVDVTGRRGDLSWLGRVPPPDPSLAPAPDSRSGDAPRPRPPVAFFARVRKGRLEPLDVADLAEGELILIRVEKVEHVPSTSSLRRIAARGGPASLPADFAEQHDHYSRGAARK